MGKDWVVIRYAEVLLTYAEAMNELHPLSAESFDAVNQVRRRVGMPDLQNTDPSKPTYCATQDELRKRIQNEWRVEFALKAVNVCGYSSLGHCQRSFECTVLGIEDETCRRSSRWQTGNCGLYSL